MAVPWASSMSTADDAVRLPAVEPSAADLLFDVAVGEDKRRYATVHVQQVEDMSLGYANAC